MISLVHRTVFVHIPKCGGQSVESAFLSDLGLNWVDHRKLLLCFQKPEPAWPGRHDRLAHLTAAEYRQHYLPPALFDDFFTFALVRDPYRKVESHYFYGRFSEQMGFDRFVQEVLPRRVRTDSFFAPQASFFCDEMGFQLIDQIYPLEQIADHWPQIQRRANLRAALPHKNASRRDRPVRWTPVMRQVVERLYIKDFDLLPYPHAVDDYLPLE